MDSDTTGKYCSNTLWYWNCNAAVSQEQETPTVAVFIQLRGQGKVFSLLHLLRHRVLLKESQNAQKEMEKEYIKRPGMEELKLKLQFKSKDV